MRRILLILIALVLAVPASSAERFHYLKKKVAAAGGASVVGNNGDTTGASTGSAASNTTGYTASASFTAKSMLMYWDPGVANITYAVYADNGASAPGALLGSTDNTSFDGQAVGWKCANLLADATITSGNVYYLSWMLETSTINYYYTGTTAPRWGLTATFPTWPDPYVGDATTARNVFIYVSSEVCP